MQGNKGNSVYNGQSMHNGPQSAFDKYCFPPELMETKQHWWYLV